MILVHLPATWPQVLASQMSAADATLGDWYGLSEAKLTEYGDALIGVFEHQVVSAYDVSGWHRTSEGKIVFNGTPSKKWAHLIGTPNPGKPWGVRGKARPIQYLDTRIIAATTAPIEKCRRCPPRNARRIHPGHRPLRLRSADSPGGTPGHDPGRSRLNSPGIQPRHRCAAITTVATQRPSTQ